MISDLDIYRTANLRPKDRRFAEPVHVRDLVNMRTGELMSFRGSTGALFPSQMCMRYVVFLQC